MKTADTESKVTEENKLLDLVKIPRHVAIIMDGNRRWAKKNNLPSVVGHTKGAETLTQIVKAALDLKIKALTVFAFSTENWGRSSEEINDVMNLFSIYLKKQLKFMIDRKISLNVIGDLKKCPMCLQEDFRDTVEKTKNGDDLKLVIAVNYGSKDEIRRAFLKIVQDLEKKIIIKEDISEELISKYLDTKDYSDPELLIRTSGEKRLSNFLLWQLSYAEIYYTDILWPAFSKKDFMEAIAEYQNRKRRFGA